jgi:glycerol-3-phosphate dehydrogenase (NAD(P)+)
MNTAVIGAGGWGTSFSILLAAKGLPVRLWVREAEVCEQLEKNRVNHTFLPGFTLPPGVTFHRRLDEAMTNSEIAFIAVPSRFCRRLYQELAPWVTPRSVIVSLTKGMEETSLLRMSEVMEEIFAPDRRPRVAVLSGPSFAQEVAAGLPAAVVTASRDLETARAVQHIVSGPSFRAYASADIVGVEIAGAVKNTMAIAAGISDALGFGHNSRAALITRGLAEMARLGVRCGGQRETFSGLAGLGDLILTCTGELSRNRRLGLELGRGRRLEDILSSTATVAEGVPTTQSAKRLSEKLDIEMPISEQVYRVLYERIDPRQALQELMARKLKEE